MAIPATRFIQRMVRSVTLPRNRFTAPTRMVHQVIDPQNMPATRSEVCHSGPFLALLKEDFARGLRLIDRMLDRGARVRLETLSTLHRQMGGDPNAQSEGLQLDFTASGPRTFVGDQHAWSWYRGSSVGPYPCMSALFALEMFMDGCVRSGIDVDSITKRIMRDATTHASVGLWFNVH